MSSTKTEIDESIRAAVTFYFKSGLVPGTYFINAGVKQGNDRDFLHRVVDICFFKINQDARSPRFGACDLKAQEASIHID